MESKQGFNHFWYCGVSFVWQTCKQNQYLKDNRVTYEHQPKKALVKLRWKLSRQVKQTDNEKKMEEIKMNNYDHLRS